MGFLLLLQEMRTPFLDGLFLIITSMGEEVFVLAPLLVFYWCINKKTGLRIGFTYFAGGIAGQFAKLVFRVERPFVRDARLSPQQGAVEAATGYSFPSGHTTSATSLASAMVLSFRSNWKVWAGGAVYVAAVGLSRMYLGVHTPWDVLCAIALAIIMAVVVDAAWSDCQRNPQRAKYYLGLCGAAAIAMAVYAQCMVSMGRVPQNQAADGFKTSGAAIALVLGVALEGRYINFSVKAPPAAQVLKFIVGVALALLIKEGLKHVLGTSLYMQWLRYFATVLFVVAGYPWLFTKAIKNRKQE